AKGRNYKALPLDGDLAKAVRRESAQAVMFWFGVKSHTAWKWRRALGVERSNAGTHALLSAHALGPEVVAGRAKAHAKSRDPRGHAARRGKLAAAKRGRAPPRHVLEALRRANLGRKHPAEARARMSASHKARGTRPPKAGVPWSAEEDALLRELP